MDLGFVPGRGGGEKRSGVVNVKLVPAEMLHAGEIVSGASRGQAGGIPTTVGVQHLFSERALRWDDEGVLTECYVDEFVESGKNNGFIGNSAGIRREAAAPNEVQGGVKESLEEKVTNRSGVINTQEIQRHEVAEGGVCQPMKGFGDASIKSRMDEHFS